MKSILGEGFSKQSSTYFKDKEMLIIFDDFEQENIQGVELFEHIF